MANDNQAYKVLQDTSLPRAIREIDELVGGEKHYEEWGAAYAAGDVVYREEITPRLYDDIDSGVFDDFLEEIDRDEAERLRLESDRQGTYGVFVPEHEAEREVQQRYGHEVVDRSVLLEVNSERADEAREAQEDGRDSGASSRPNLTSPPTPDLATASREGTTALPESQVEDYNNLTKAELVERAKARGVDSSGNKSEIIDRLESVDREGAAVASGGTTATQDEG